ncbi:DNA helicase B isoform X2 [Petaurus breviceps papuanus]|uniref:DNA helicase B isoform X2 n=1 Tax=Petaurus breviceps papuanus TaxID=3040969 RepID=UPI0036D85A3E
MGTLRVLRGSLLPDKELQDEEDEGEDAVVEEDLEDEPLFVDAEELCNGGLRSGSLPARQPDDFTLEFLKWVYERSSYYNLRFENLQEALKDFEEKWQKKSSGKKDGNSSQEEKNESLLNKNPIALETVMRALKFPRIMEFIPILLPRHFNNLLGLKHSESLFRDLEEILNTCPWKLGFRRIIYRELKLIGCEATWPAFCQCEFLFQKMSSLEKNALMTYNKLKQICREYGHTYVKEAELTSYLSGKIPFQDVWSSLKFLKDIGVVTNEKECIFLSDLYEAERDIAFLVHDLMTSPSWNLKVDVEEVLASMETRKSKHAEGDDAVNTSKPQEEKLENDGHALDMQSHSNQVFHSDENEIDFEMPSHVHLDQDQMAALKMICSNAVTVVSGKGGCGKTTIVSHLFKYVEQMEKREVWKACEDFEQDLDAPEEWNTFVHQREWNNDRNERIEVLLTAPTGKAASLLREKTRLAAYTLHQVKYSFYSWQKINQELEEKIPWKFSSVKVLVVDEGSLVCIAIFRSVLNLLRKHARLVKLVILGDIRQLPSIEPGNLLMDLFETLKSRNCAVELKTNHRAESQLIVDNAARISRRQFPKFDAELKISDCLDSSMPDQNKRFIFVRLPEDDSHSQSSQRNSYLYSAVNTLLHGAVELKKPETSQFIAFRKQDCDIINECCCSFYSGHLPKNHENRFIFQKDDKICCTRNAYLSDLLQSSSSLQNEDLKLSHTGDPNTFHSKKSKKSHGSENDIRLCNGEIFYITNDVQNENGRFLTITNMAGLEVTVDFKKLVNFCRIRHAWARTIHTFQGSEEDTVVYVIGKAGRQHWQHVYTAVTRGRSRVYVIAEESQLWKAVKQNSLPRKTRLKHFLQRNFADSSTFPTEVSSPSRNHGQSKGHSFQPSATPLDSAIPGTVGNSFIKTRGSVANDVASVTNAGEKWVSFEETGEDSLELRGTKRSTTNDLGSPNKLLLVEQTSPLVSARLQNMTLNSLTPKQLFKTAVNEGT